MSEEGVTPIRAAIRELARSITENSTTGPQSPTSGEVKDFGAKTSPASYKHFRTFLDFTMSAKDCVDLVANGREDVSDFLSACSLRMAKDMNIATLCCVALANISGMPECRQHIAPTPMLIVILDAINAFPTEKKLVHLACMTMSNLGLVPDLLLTQESSKAIVSAIAPLYAEHPVVEAWCAAVCNISSYDGTNRNLLVAAGAIETVERLLVFHGDVARVVHRGLQCLSNLSGAHVEMPPPPTVART